MQTNFTEDQLKDKDNKSSEKIFRACVHCGFCNATCPSYKILNHELDGPRGRIYLIKDMLENNKPADAKITKHIDQCLSCYGCMTTCPSGVNYMHLIDHGRKHIEKTYTRPISQRIVRNILSKILTNHKLFKFLGVLGQIIKPFRIFLPKKLKNILNVLPSRFPKKTMPLKKIYSPKGKKIVARVALLTGCVQKVLSPQINESTIRLLNRHGVEVVVPESINCCGSLEHHLGKETESLKNFKQNIDVWYNEYLNNGLDAIISNTSGCGTTLKDYGFIFRDDTNYRKKAKKISQLSKDITEYLSENIKLNFNNKNKFKKFKIAYHSACSMQHGQKVHDDPINLIKKTGNDVINIPEGHLCCGSAGTYNLLQSEIANQLLKNKIENIQKINPEIISTGNIGCISQISSATSIPILHTVEILDWYTGGPKPKVLERI